MAQVTGLTPGKVHWVGGDVHIYKNHIRQVAMQLEREPLPVPTLEVANHTNIDDFDFNTGDILLSNYEAHPHIKGAVSV